MERQMHCIKQKRPCTYLQDEERVDVMVKDTTSMVVGTLKRLTNLFDTPVVQWRLCLFGRQVGALEGIEANGGTSHHHLHVFTVFCELQYLTVTKLHVLANPNFCTFGT